MSIAALIVAGGRGVRFSASHRKQYATLAGRPVLAHSIELFENLPEFDAIWLVVPAQELESGRLPVDLSNYRKIAGRVAGGDRRQDSVWAGLCALPGTTEIVAVHDAVRPLAPADAVRRAVAGAREVGGAILAAPAVDTIKRCDAQGRIVETLDRTRLWLAQTPQVFRFDLLREAYQRVADLDVEVTDEAAAVEGLGKPVEVIAVSEPNPKITTPHDLRFAEWLLSERGRT
jgi:2-C-methyl-D-erythritol 4-phosphate cytidylyltransferase